jgi:hypothetical protein
MKLNFQLDLNTIVLLLLIVVFSVIIYYNFKKGRIIEGNTSALDNKKTEYSDKNAQLALYQRNQTLYAAAWSTFTTARNTLNSTRAEYNSLVRSVSSNNSSASIMLYPNTNDIKYKMDNFTSSMQTKLNELNTIHSEYQDITDFITINEQSTQTNFNTNNNKISSKILELKASITNIKSEIIGMIGFTIGPIVPGNKQASITINQSPDATITTYDIKAIDSKNNSISREKVTSPYIFTDLTNDTPYTFSVTADYGVLSDGTKLTNTTTYATSVTPRTKPSFTLNMRTGSAAVNIATSTGNPAYTISVTSSTGETATYPVGNNTRDKSIPNLINGIKYDFKVLADYGNGKIIESDVISGTPRASPTLSANFDDKTAILTIREPNVADKPVSYTINPSPPDIPINTVSNISNPIKFKGLRNGTRYTFSVVGIYIDGSKSSPSTVQVTPRARPPPPVPRRVPARRFRLFGRWF